MLQFKYLGFKLTITNYRYAAIAQRIGVKLEMVGMPSHFLVKWVDPVTDNEIFIDSFGGGRYFTFFQLENLQFY